MTAWDTLVDGLRTEQLDRTYLGQPAPDPLDELIGILASLLGEEKTRIRREASRKQRKRIDRELIERNVA